MIRGVSCAELQQKASQETNSWSFTLLTMNLFGYSCETYFISQDLGMVSEKPQPFQQISLPYQHVKANKMNTISMQTMNTHRENI